MERGVLPYMAFSGCAAGKGMVFVLSILNRVYKFARVCPKQGIQFVQVCPKQCA